MTIKELRFMLERMKGREETELFIGVGADVFPVACLGWDKDYGWVLEAGDVPITVERGEKG